MLDKVFASRLERKMTNGRTSPCLITCETDHEGGNDIELIVKFSAECFEKEKNLVIEALAAMLGADLGLPVPEPFLVGIDDFFINSIGDAQLQQLVRSSNRIAFGSRKLPDGFAVWPCEGRVGANLTTTAAEVFVFDAIIANSDRRPSNPNCLHSGEAIGIFDHELSLASQQVLFWKAPWLEGGFDNISEHGNHIFAPSNFEVRPINLDRFRAAWESISDDRLKQYCEALPFEWGDHDEYLETTVKYLKEVKSNISEIVIRGLEKLS